jgi:hypothetical protein
MTAIARVCQLDESFGKFGSVLGLNRFAEIRKWKLALLLNEACDRNAFEDGIELRCRGKALLNLP